MGVTPVGTICTVGSVVVATGAGKRLNKVLPPPKPGIPPPRPNAIRVVNEGVAAGILTTVAIVGKVVAIVGTNGNGEINVVGKMAPAVRFTSTVTVGVGAGWSVGTSDVTVSPATVTCGTTTVKGVKFGDVKGIAAVLNKGGAAKADKNGDTNGTVREGTPKGAAKGEKPKP